MKHFEFMKIAIDEAIEGMNKKHGGPFGAVVVRNGEIISSAHSEVFKNNDPTAHAEVVAIRKAAEKIGRPYLDDAEYTIYSTCEPCPMCLGAIYWGKIKNIYYGCTKEDAKKYGFEDKDIYEVIEHKRLPMVKTEQLHRMPCLETFRIWKTMQNHNTLKNEIAI